MCFRMEKEPSVPEWREKGNCGRRKDQRGSCRLGNVRLGEVQVGHIRTTWVTCFDPHSNQVRKLLSFVSLLLIRRGLVKCNRLEVLKPSFYPHQGFPGGLDGKESACHAGDPGSVPGSGRSSGEGNGYPLQYSCLGNPINGGAWWAVVHGVAKCWTRLSD